MSSHTSCDEDSLNLLEKEAEDVVQNYYRPFKVLVSGGATEIGQSIALLLKLNPLVSDLNIFDEANEIPGLAMDLCHINTSPRVWGYKNANNFKNILKGLDIVIVAGGLTTSPYMSAESLFCTNAESVIKTVELVAQYSPCAVIIIVTNPVNSLLPLASEVMKAHNKYDPRKLFGLTTLDVMRASAFIGDVYWTNPEQVDVPVIGGHAGITIVPVFSQSNIEVNLPLTRIKKLTHMVQNAGALVAKCKQGKGGATLSTAYAAARLTDAVLKGLSGKENLVECAYVKSAHGDTAFFANPVNLGKSGMERNLGCGKLNDYECQLLKDAIPALQEHIQTGLNFAKKHTLIKT